MSSSRSLSHPSGGVDSVEFKTLYEKQNYDVLTSDGWSLVVTRYKPIPQAFQQPLLGSPPLLLVHGFSQNRHAWTSGEFVKNLLFFGADVHILELRGHGLSSIAHQEEKWRNEGLPLPVDLDYGWTFDSYALEDVPAAIEAVKAKTGARRVAYVGHSMGGMVGFYQASHRDDVACLVTIGTPAEIGRGAWALRAFTHVSPALAVALDAGLAATNVGLSVLDRLRERKTSVRLHYKYLPMDWLFDVLDRALSDENFAIYSKFSPAAVVLFNPRHTALERVRWLLRRGTGREPRGVTEQLGRWIRTGRMTLNGSGEDIRHMYKNIDIPLAIIFGDRDYLASVNSTRRAYHHARSEYLLWRPVRGNSHLELTMGHDIRQICYDIKNIVEYAWHADERPRALPRTDK